MTVLELEETPEVTSSDGPGRRSRSAVTRRLGRELVWAPVTMVIVTFVVFLLMDVAPGDAATTIAGEQASPEVVAAIRSELRLDQPLSTRYLGWLGDAATGDLGSSLVSHKPVLDVVRSVFPATISLVGMGLVFAILIALLLGVLPVYLESGPFDRITSVLSALALSMPPFWLALLLTSWFALKLDVLPAMGYVGISENPWQWFLHLVLPALAVAMVPAGELARQVRGSLLDVLDQDYSIAQQVRGLPRRSVVLRHGLKNAAVPVVTLLGARIGAMVGSTVIIERIFVINGMGELAVQSVMSRDVPVVLGIVVFGTAIVLVSNLLVDVSYGFFSPRSVAT